MLHPGVQQAAVVLTPDPVLGEKTFAFPVPARGADGASLAELRRMLRGRGPADHQLLDLVQTVSAPPLTGLIRSTRTRCGPSPSTREQTCVTVAGVEPRRWGIGGRPGGS